MRVLPISNEWSLWPKSVYIKDFVTNLLQEVQHIEFPQHGRHFEDIAERILKENETHSDLVRFGTWKITKDPKECKQA
jgi:hypothetical protein